MSIRNSWKLLRFTIIYVIVWPGVSQWGFSSGGCGVSLFGSGLSAAVALRARILDRIGAEEA